MEVSLGSNRIYAQFGGKELLILCIYLIEYMLINYFSNIFCSSTKLFSNTHLSSEKKDWGESKTSQMEDKEKQIHNNTEPKMKKKDFHSQRINRYEEKGVNGKATLHTCLTGRNKQILQGARSEKSLPQEGTIGAM